MTRIDAISNWITPRHERKESGIIIKIFPGYM